MSSTFVLLQIPWYLQRCRFFCICRLVVRFTHCIACRFVKQVCFNNVNDNNSMRIKKKFGNVIRIYVIQFWKNHVFKWDPQELFEIQTDINTRKFFGENISHLQSLHRYIRISTSFVEFIWIHIQKSSCTSYWWVVLVVLIYLWLRSYVYIFMYHKNIKSIGFLIYQFQISSFVSIYIYLYIIA